MRSTEILTPPSHLKLVVDEAALLTHVVFKTTDTYPDDHSSNGLLLSYIKNPPLFGRYGRKNGSGEKTQGCRIPPTEDE